MIRYFCNPIFCCPIGKYVNSNRATYSGWERATFSCITCNVAGVSDRDAIEFLGGQPDDWRETPRGVALQIVRDRLVQGALC